MHPSLSRTATLLLTAAVALATVVVVPARSAAAGTPRLTASSGRQALAAAPAVPRYDHVVMVIMENHSADSIIPNAAAPYINSLASTGANMTQSFGVTHPSQPNYIALFAGSQLGVVDNTCPNTLNADNLGAQLIAAGQTFVGYSESMPSAGYTGCATASGYARKHNPWVNFPTVPAASNQPLTSLPTDWAALPTVSIVVPNLFNDMHDGTIAQADSWLHDGFDGYLQWAKTHNSLLVVTFDEDDNNAGNRIPTIFAGAGVRAGQYPERITHYNMLRTLQDMYGLPPLANTATAGPIVDIWTSSPANQPPVASFTGSCVQLVCSVDAAAATDAEGPIAGYTWDWGDGTTGAGVTAGHTYSAPGAKTVTLLVTDSVGATATTTRVVNASGPSNGQPFAADAFARTRLTGWGAADVGGTWSVGSSANSSVAPAVGTLVVGLGQTNTAYLPSASSSDTDLRTTLSVDRLPTGNGVYLSVMGRRTGPNLEYDARVMVRADGQLGLLLTSLAGSSTVVTLKPQIIVPAVTMTNGAAAKIRLQVTGINPTTIRAKVWQATATEPTAWQLTATDAFAGLQTAGSVGVSPYLSSGSTVSPISLRFSDFSARPTNQPPTAAFTGSCALLSCSVDAAGSSDPDGSIASYSWNWGDGTTTSGATSSHAYTVAGSYPVTLTVIDNAGTPTTVSHVLIAERPPNIAPSAAFTVSCNNFDCATNSSGSADPDGVIAGYLWNWGDGTTSTGADAPHHYLSPGSRTVTLTVTDDRAATATATRDITITAPATTPPAAAFTVTCALLVCTVDGRASTDPDGTIAGYSWNWGDGATDTGSTMAHTYLTPGDYTVTLTVTDNDGGTGTVTHTATPVAPANQPPTAVASGSCESLSCSVSAAGSTDPDGTITGYSWNWGDGSSATAGSTAGHVYASAGTFTATLTVTDNQGATATAQRHADGHRAGEYTVRLGRVWANADLRLGDGRQRWCVDGQRRGVEIHRGRRDRVDGRQGGGDRLGDAGGRDLQRHRPEDDAHHERPGRWERDLPDSRRPAGRGKYRIPGTRPYPVGRFGGPADQCADRNDNRGHLEAGGGAQRGDDCGRWGCDGALPGDRHGTEHTSTQGVEVRRRRACCLATDDDRRRCRPPEAGVGGPDPLRVQRFGDHAGDDQGVGLLGATRHELSPVTN